MHSRILLVAAVAVFLQSWNLDIASAAEAEEAVAADAAASSVVLDLDRGSFRAFLAWRTGAMADAKGQIKPLLEPLARGVKEEDRRPLPIKASAEPGANWSAADFDDSDWMRHYGGLAVQSDDGWDRMWLRGRFAVDDPQQAGDVTLTLRYLGGVAVYLNGTEVARQDLPAGEVGPRTFATYYPTEAYLRPDGKLYGRLDGKEFGSRMQVRYRRLAGKGDANGVVIPARLLKKGVNVLAVQCVGAPVAEAATSAPQTDGRGAPGLWPHAGILKLQLTARSAGHVTPNVGPTDEVSIGNVPPAQTMMVWDYVENVNKLGSVRLIGARNGSFSGRVALSSARTISGLKATPGELTSADGKSTIPAAAIRIRWADQAKADTSWVGESRFDRLLSEPPAEVAPMKIELRGQSVQPPVAAVVPVWITVQVPENAPAGEYRGNVVIEASAEKPVRFTVPVEVKVFDWKVPGPEEQFLMNNIHHSPDSVAKYYKVEPWSDEHLKLMGESLGILKEVGSQVCILNLVVRAHAHGNEQSMVRWIKQPDGSYKHDFTLAEKYMDLFEKVGGKPRVVQVNAWMFGGDDPKRAKWPPEGVTVLDTDGKRLDDLQQPPYGTDENEAFWRPVLTELRKRLERRGWWDVTYLAWLTYAVGPPKSMVDVAMKIWPDASWYKNAHATDKAFNGSKGSMPVKYSAWVWGCGALYNPDVEHPWAKPPVFHETGRRDYPRPWQPRAGFTPLTIPRIGVAFTQPGLYDHASLMRCRTVPEAMLQGDLCGMSMVGGDFWPLPLGARGRLGVLCDGRGGVTPTNNTKAMLSPGPKGPVYSERLESLREGIQIAEAIVLVRKGIESGKLDEALKGRAEDLLDERARQYCRNCTPLPGGPSYDATWMTLQATDWRERDEKLFAMAAEVAGRLAGK